ncbi:FAD-dependent oxidoreductase [Naasia aerilata]|uniref:FAD-dependent oxidoreductase n=1 Tax=Naasia aerilata TaxID=1162966 RepID=UPI003306024B
MPFPTYGAVRLDDQAQFDPLDVLRALAADFRGRGGTIAEGVRVTGVRAVARRPGQPSVVHTSAGDVLARRVVLATGIPILDRGLYFAKVSASRSYALSFRVPDGSVASDFGMFLSVDAPKRTLRTTPAIPADAAGEGDLLIVGGNGHRVGHHPHPHDLVEDLESWTQAYYPGAERTHVWSAQDYHSANTIPFVGWLPRSLGRVFLATGFDKWGMTNAVAAGLRLAGDLLGGNIPWATTLGTRITRPQSMAAGALVNAEVGADLVTGWAHGLTESGEGAPPPPEGQGEVRRIGGRPVAVCTVGGVTREVSAVCPHLRGIVRWNDQELSWDCPLHASRYQADGTRIEGPTTEDLAAL